MAIVTRAGSLFIWWGGFIIAALTAGSCSQAGGILLVLCVTVICPTALVSPSKQNRIHTTVVLLLGSIFQLLEQATFLQRLFAHLIKSVLERICWAGHVSPKPKRGKKKNIKWLYKPKEISVRIRTPQSHRFLHLSFLPGCYNHKQSEMITCHSMKYFSISSNYFHMESSSNQLYVCALLWDQWGLFLHTTKRSRTYTTPILGTCLTGLLLQRSELKWFCF